MGFKHVASQQEPDGAIAVYFTGTTALEKGQALCYDIDRGTATDADGNRYSNVELPAVSGYQKYAGTAIQDYPANSQGQLIKITPPGTCGWAACLADTVINVTRLTYTRSATAALSGYFVVEGLPGKGTCEALQTSTNVRASALDGGGALSSTTLTDAGVLGTAVTTGDKCRIYGSTDQATTVGSYDCTQVAGTDTTTISSAAGNATEVSYVISPVVTKAVWVYFEDGEESGGVEFISPANGADQSMVGGLTYLTGGYTVGTGDSTSTLADGTRQGELKKFYLNGALTTNDYVLTVTSGLQRDGSTQLAAAEFDGSGDELVLQWWGTEWTTLINKGVAIS